jgi:hypothetical protein
MILFFGMQLVPLGYGIAYLVHSAAKRRKGQAAAIAALLLIQIAAAGILLWEYLNEP